MKNNASNKDWHLFQMDNNTNSSEGYKNDKQETNVEKERLKKVDNKADYAQKLKKQELIEENKGKTLVSEGIDANYHDMINYSIFALIHLSR